MSGPLAIWILVLGASAASAAPPALTGLHPAGLAIGGPEVIVEAIGTSAWPVKAWCSSPSVRIEPLEEKGKLRIAANADAMPGPVLIRLYNAEGSSEARIFVLGRGPEILETQPNDRLADAQAITTLPVTVNGIFEKRGDVDFFRLTLRKGQTISAQLDSYVLRSEIDPFLHLIAPDGRELALASDTQNLDPALVAEIPADGVYIVELNAIGHKANAEVSFAGGKDKVYRLHLQAGPLAQPDLPKPDSLEGPGPVKAPCRIQGTLSAPGERDRYRIEAEPGAKLRIRVEAASLHLPMDPVLRVYRPDGGLLREIDDAGTLPDPVYDLTVPKDGFFDAEVRDRFRRQGMIYQLVVGPVVPVFRVTATQDAVMVPAGKSAELTLQLTREDGHSAPLELALADLPAGVTWKAEAIPDKTGPFKLTLSAPETAAAFQGPFHITVGTQPVVRTWQTEESRGDYLINETADFWITVTPAPAPK
ncbi:MAG: PPC domain-containing protein [Verrucomicrobiales bacterium]